MSAILEKLKNRFPHKSFARNVLTLMSGTVIAQALMVLVAPVLTRLYTPSEFGLFALYFSLLQILGVVSCGRYELAIVLPKEDNEAANLFTLSLFVCLFTSFFAFLIFLFFRSPIAKAFNTPALSFWLLIMPVQLFTQGVFLSLNYWGTRRKQFARLASRQATQSLGTSIGQISLGFLEGGNGGGLIFGALIGQTLATFRLALQTLKEDGSLIRHAFSKESLFDLFRRYRNFPLYSTWTSFMNTLSTMLPSLLLGYYFDSRIVGFYALGYRVLSLPLSLMGSALAQAFYPHATEAYRAGKLSRTTLNMFSALIDVGSLPFILLTVLAPDAFSLIFGHQWHTAGVYLRWLALWIFLVFISSPLSSVYMILEKQRLGFFVNLIMLASRFLALAIGGKSGSALLTVQLFGATGLILWIGNCLLILNMAGVSLLDGFKNVRIPALESLLFLAPTLIMLSFIGSSLGRVFIATACFALFAFFKGIKFLRKGLPA